MALSLYTATALLILDSEGNRLYARYHTTPGEKAGGAHDEEEAPLASLKQQRAFEKSLFDKTYKVQQDILLFQSQLVVYKQLADVVIYLVGGLDENEIVLFDTLEGFKDALEKLLKFQVDKKTVIENYDLVAIAADETLDNGIILETESSVIAGRTSRAPTGEVGGLNGIELTEKGLFSAFQFAKGKLAERLQQGL
jgi:hypothetical protein